MTELAGCIILDEAGRLLVLHRVTPELVQWELPGGKVEAGETPTQAAVREIAEELGVTVKILAELGSRNFRQGDRVMRYHWYLATISAGVPRPVEEKFDEVSYIALGDLARRTDLSSNLKNLLASFKSGFGPNAQSKLRRTRNELIVQKDNIRIKNLAAGVLDGASAGSMPISFACECSNPDCETSLAITAAHYTRIHDQPGWFAVAPGHEQNDIEKVIEQHPDGQNTEFLIVEKMAVAQGELFEQ